MCFGSIIRDLKNMDYIKKFDTVVVGGSFDHFHKGHIEFLRLAFSSGKKAIVGITSDKYIRVSSIKHYASSIEPYKTRKKAVGEFLEKEGVIDRSELLEIYNVFGPTLDPKPRVEAIVVAERTKEGASIINKKRREKGLKSLEVIVAEEVLAEDGKPISSERIRKGEIDRAGKIYVKKDYLNKDLVLPEDARKIFKKPFGDLLQEGSLQTENLRGKIVVTVGDVTTKLFRENGLVPSLSIVDFRVQREQKFKSVEDLGFGKSIKMVEVGNHPGHISRELFSEVLFFFKHGNNDTVIIVKGEEDLAVLPVVLSAPLGVFIFYGQPNLGLVRVVVDEVSKKRALNLISMFQ